MRLFLVAIVVGLMMCAFPMEADADDAEVTADAGAGAVPLAAAAVPVVTAPTESLEITEAPPDAAAPPPAAGAPSTWSGLGWQLLGYVVPVLGALLTALVGFGIQWLRAKTRDLKWQSVLDQLDDAVDTAVAAVQQSVVDGLKAAGDGKLTKFEAKEAAAAALDAVKLTLGTKGLATLASAMQAGQEAVEGYLRSKVEAAVAAQKVAP